VKQKRGTEQYGEEITQRHGSFIMPSRGLSICAYFDAEVFGPNPQGQH
jgi:hypothetical protein